jgi:hypothetical protein
LEVQQPLSSCRVVNTNQYKLAAEFSVNMSDAHERVASPPHSDREMTDLSSPWPCLARFMMKRSQVLTCSNLCDRLLACPRRRGASLSPPDHQHPSKVLQICVRSAKRKRSCTNVALRGGRLPLSRASQREWNFAIYPEPSGSPSTLHRSD